MEHLINNRVQLLEASLIREFSERVQQFSNSINLTIGQPDFNTPTHVKEAGKKAIDTNKTGYTNNTGLPELRQVACHFIRKKYGLLYSWETETIVMNGATQALDTVFRTILDEGCEVILPGPAYPGYQPLIEMCGAKPVFVDTSDTAFKITAKLIEEHITEKTRCVLLSYPSNPVGTVLSKDELNEIAMLLKEKDIFIVSDEIYSELIYEKEHCSIASFPEVRNQTIVINGISKSHAMTGWRIGFLFAPEYVTNQMLKVHIFNTTCACSISQEAAVEALTNGLDAPIVMREEYSKRRDYVYERLISMGLQVTKPEAAFYIFPSIEPFQMTSFKFTNLLLEKEHVAVVPGAAFSSVGENYIRISFASSMSVLEEGLNRMERFVNALEVKEVIRK
ncbi:aminotransferase A [Virgibacillus sp. W0181]|uniref:aminotransferase A n=1 Tax=Virgibacillus sp. W0181 TaxID=3391581 RepID=UPI003F446A3E